MSAPTPSAPSHWRSARRRTAGWAAAAAHPQRARRPVPRFGEQDVASSSAASASSTSASSRSCPAVRASAGATPPASTCSSSGNTSWRTRNPGEPGVGVVRVVPDRQPRAAQAARVTVRRTPSSGRATAGSRRPYRRSSVDRTRGPARAARSRPGRRGCARAAPASPDRARGTQRGVSGAPGRGLRARPGRRRRPRPPAAGTPSPASSSTVAAVRSAEPSCRPWSTTTRAPARSVTSDARPSRGPASRRRRSRRPAAARPGRRRAARASPHRPATRPGVTSAIRSDPGRPATRPALLALRSRPMPATRSTRDPVTGGRGGSRPGSASSARVGRFSGLSTPGSTRPCRRPAPRAR